MGGSGPAPAVAAASSSSAANGLPAERREDAFDELRVGRAAAERGQQLARLRAAQAPEVDAHRERQPCHLGQPVAQPAALGLVVAERRDQHDPLVAQVARQEREQVEGRRVGPVDVVDGEQQRCGRGRRPTSVSTVPRSAVAPPSGAALSPSSGSRRASWGRALADRGVPFLGAEIGGQPAQCLDDRQQRRVATCRSTQLLRTTRIPACAADSSRAPSSVVLPTPASPPISRQPGSPATALSSTCRTSASSAARPTRTSLVVRRTVAPIISQGAPLVEIRRYRAWE